MRTKSLVLIMIALGCGLVASIGISQVMERKDGGVQAIEMEEILVAAIDIDIGKKLDAQNVKLEQWPKARVPEGALRKLEEITDSFTRARLYAGEPILSAKLMDSNNPSAGGTIPDGFVVIPIKVELDTVIGLIQPGDLVDIMVFLRQGPDIPRTGSYTILRMVRIFAVNTQTDRTVDDKGQEISAKTVSVLVKPKQGERLALATEMGKLRLALRRPTDEIPPDSEIESELPTIFRNGEKTVAIDPTPKEPSAAETTSSLPNILNLAIKMTEPAPIPTPVEPAGPNWTMRVFTPSEVRQFDWNDAKGLPYESVLGAGAPAIPPSAPVSIPPSDSSSDEPPMKRSVGR